MSFPRKVLPVSSSIVTMWPTASLRSLIGMPTVEVMVRACDRTVMYETTVRECAWGRYQRRVGEGVLSSSKA